MTAGPVLIQVYLFLLYCILASLNSSTEIRVVGEGGGGEVPERAVIRAPLQITDKIDICSWP